MSAVTVIGAGLAGCEAAHALAKQGIDVKLFEMKPQRRSPAHKSDLLCELVCSNSLRSNKLDNAVGLLKEELRLVFHHGLEAGKEQLDHFIKWAQHCRIPEFVELQRKIRRHYDAILATLEHKLSNARIEAVNNKIKLTIRMAYGFRNIDNMIDMIMLRCSDIEVNLPWEGHSLTHTC